MEFARIIPLKPADCESMDTTNFKKQQTILVLLNIAVIAALFFVHILFLMQIGTPSRALLATLGSRFLLLIAELYWLQSVDETLGERAINAYTSISIWLNIVFAFGAAVFGGTADSHYSVLMIIPIVQAAYNFNLPKTIGVVSAASLLTVLEVWIFYQRKPPVDFGEFFEAATVSLIFFVIGIVVWLLVGNLRQRQNEIRRSLETLERTQMRLVAEEKLAAVGRLSAAIAHEIRNPVALIASSLEMALKNPENSPVRAEMFDILTSESRRLETLTGDFLTFARTRPPRLATHEPVETLEHVAALTRGYASEREIEIAVHVGETTPIDYDSEQLTQAIVNLVMNSADVLKSGGRLSVGFVPPATFYVSNDGPAIGTGDVGQLFEPFFTTKPKGTGLGLAIVRSIAVAHGGDAVLASNEDGNVRFEIRLEAHGKDPDR